MMHTRRADPGLAAWLCVALLALPGCVSISVSAALGPRLSPQLLDLFVPGETTRARALEVLGPPEEYLRHELLDSLGDDATRVSGAVRIGNRAQDVFTWQHDRFDAQRRDRSASLTQDLLGLRRAGSRPIDAGGAAADRVP